MHIKQLKLKKVEAQAGSYKFQFDEIEVYDKEIKSKHNILGVFELFFEKKGEKGAESIMILRSVRTPSKSPIFFSVIVKRLYKKKITAPKTSVKITPTIKGKSDVVV